MQNQTGKYGFIYRIASSDEDEVDNTTSGVAGRFPTDRNTDKLSPTRESPSLAAPTVDMSILTEGLNESNMDIEDEGMAL